MTINLSEITSPKLRRSNSSEWEAYSPYYAGFSEAFVFDAIRAARLPVGSNVYDPWNGSGTTTYAAAASGMKALGCDLNPVMVLAARSRLLPSSELDSLPPLAKKLSSRLRFKGFPGDPLESWFEPTTARSLRALERSIASALLGPSSSSNGRLALDQTSSIAATFYVALFALCRRLTLSFRSTNPTWVRIAKDPNDRLKFSNAEIAAKFRTEIDTFCQIVSRRGTTLINADAKVFCGNSTLFKPRARSIDLIVSSPPYCTRIDYTAATRVELAVLAPVLAEDPLSLSRTMIGSTRVPLHQVSADEEWGQTSLAFLSKLARHPSRASNTYYYKTHLDYFDKLWRSMQNIVPSLKRTGRMMLIVQDSHYKELHNDLARVVSEMGQALGMQTTSRRDFTPSQSMAYRNRFARQRAAPLPTESVLVLAKN